MTSSTSHRSEYTQVSRRAFLTQSLHAAGAFLFGNQLAALPAWMPSIRLANPHIGPAGDTLVSIFLRGGADGLNMIVPHGDDEYYVRRPTIGIARPDDHRSDGSALDLDGYFGLHPALSPLHDLYRANDLAIIHATGSPDETRSHFKAMELMERGTTEGGAYTGWLTRHLATLDTGNQSALRAIGVGDMLPASLSGAVSATALESIAEYHLMGSGERVGRLQALLQTLYNQRQDLLTEAANQTFAAIEVLGKVNVSENQALGRTYPEGRLGKALNTVAQLIRADVGVEVACVDMGGWDTHVAQGGSQGLMSQLMAELARSLAAFHEDLGSTIDRVTIVIMSEFGRRVQENGGLGTDHGHGNMMMVLGGGINGGQVYARWPGLRQEQLVGPGDLAITIDYRDILGEILRRRLNNRRVQDVFPGYSIEEIGLAVNLNSEP